MKEKSHHKTTTFQISNHLYTQMKTMCVITEKSMGEFIRLAIMDKINQLRTPPPMEK